MTDVFRCLSKKISSNGFYVHSIIIYYIYTGVEIVYLKFWVFKIKGARNTHYVFVCGVALPKIGILNKWLVRIVNSHYSIILQLFVLR